jgi:hypothetical protein
MPNPIKTLWRGKYPLWLAFWGFYVVGYFPMAWLTMNVASHIDAQPWRWLVAVLMTVPYNILSTVGAWRSADAYPLTRWWPNMAKIIVCLWSGRIAWQLGQGTLFSWKEWMG